MFKLERSSTHPAEYLALRAKHWRLLAGLLVGLLGALGAPLTAQNSFNYHGSTSEIVWRGTQAFKLCNGLFASNRSVDQIYAQELGGMGTPMTPSRVEIDHGRKAVAVGVGGADPVPAMRSAHREGLGCVVMAPDQTFADIDKLPILRLPPVPGDPAAIPWPDGDRLEKRPLPAGVNEAALKAASDWAFDRVAHGGHAGQVTISLMVVQRGTILHERYAPGVNMHTRTRTWSTAKSIASTLIGIAVGKGLLKLDDPLPFEWPPDEAASDNDPRRQITLRHVLHMSSGLYPVDNDYGRAIGSPLAYWAGWDSAYHARDRGLIRQPGTTWDYENYDTLLAVLALKKALGNDKAYLEFPRRALLDRIGMRNTVPGVDRFGNYVLSSQVYTNARDLARFGLLYLNRGRWNGEQIVPEAWVDFVRTPAAASRKNGNDYGGQWWLVPDSRTDLPQDAYSTLGARGQFVVVVPSYDLIVVRRGLDWQRGGRALSQWDLLAEVLKAFPRRQGGTKPRNPTTDR
jgi:CubicO group peptidase (beta-lactamase class C family)